MPKAKRKPEFPTILEDKREIDSLQFNDDEGTAYHRGRAIEIKAYGEPGEHCLKPWFAVIVGGEVVTRVPASMVSVHYKKE